jgi:hypothetical protein
MEKSTIKAAILESLSSETDKWPDKQETIYSGYEYATLFMKVVQKIECTPVICQL